ncbi:MAG TPA: TonB-dependent receptor [Bacteroidota bacterium]
MKIVTHFLYLFFFLAIVHSTSLAGNTGKISGVVRDAATKEEIPGVTVVVEGTTLGASTDAQGRYVILNIPPGVYSVVASFIGYKKTVVRNVRISADFTTPMDFNLQQGDIQLDAVVVQGERTPLIRQDLTNPVVSVTAETINELPITSIDEILGLQSGVTVDDDGSIHVRGGYGNEVGYTLNGLAINNPYNNSRSVSLATNAVQEVTLSVGTFNAEYGSALSGIVNYVTKEGGGAWTGSFRHLTGDHVSSRSDLFYNIGDQEFNNVYRSEVSFGGPLLPNISFYGSAVYDWFGGSIYGQQLYRTTDTYLPRNEFPVGDPRRGLSTDPYYFGPTIHGTADLFGPPVSYHPWAGAPPPRPVAMNWRKSYNVQGNLSLRLTPTTKLKYEIVSDKSERPVNDGNSSIFNTQFKPDGRAIFKGESIIHSIDWTHTLSDKTFYTAKGSFLRDKATEHAFDNFDDPRYLPSIFLRALDNTTYLTGGVDLDRFSRKTETWSGKVDVVSQVLPQHELKFGAEARFHKVSIESYTLQFVNPTSPLLEPTFERILAGMVFEPTIPTVDGGYTFYTRKPIQLAGYIQDKIELFRSMILNVGLRYEYFKPDARYNPTVSQELAFGDKLFYDAGLVIAKPKHMFSPRISISYPITDQGTIRFSYGHFYQIGNLSSLYQNPFFRAVRGEPTFGNPNVEPQRNIQYELGMQQGLTPDLKVELTGYYKNVRDYIFTQRIIAGERGDRSYRVLTNLSFANTRGISISLLKRRAPGEFFSGTIDYTFQIADGNRTEPEADLFLSEQSGKQTETFLVPLDFDRSHTITTTLVFSQPNDWSASIIGYFRTGTPYTPAFPSNVVPITFTQNSDRQPVQWNFDLKLEKFFPIEPISFSVYLQVDNLFDTENELFVYASSGSALYTISTTSFGNIANRIQRGDIGLIPARALTNYYARPGNVSAPRLVRFGASILF